MRITATANYSARTFTIRKSCLGYSVKYRTNKLTKEDFYNCIYNTERDWKQFLKSDDYYII